MPSSARDAMTVDIHGLSFIAVSNSAEGEVDAATSFRYHQEGAVVSGRVRRRRHRSRLPGGHQDR